MDTPTKKKTGPKGPRTKRVQKCKRYLPEQWAVVETLINAWGEHGARITAYMRRLVEEDRKKGEKA